MRVSGLFCLAFLATAGCEASAEGQAWSRYCAQCHDAGAVEPVGPPLAAVANRAIGSVDGFPYSPALKWRGTYWTEDNLRAFISDPQRFAPGTAMTLPPIAAQDREEILRFLID